MRIAAYVGAVLGLTLLVALVIRADFAAMLQTLVSTGVRLFWLVPYRALYYLLYATGWLILLRPYDRERRARLGYVFWVTSIRDSIDRLLPVASVGGSIVGVRLMRWLGLEGAAVSATVIVEILLTVIVSYVFTAIGLVLLVEHNVPEQAYHHLVLAFALSLPVPVITALLLRYGSVFERMQRFLRSLVREDALSTAAVALDRELRACLYRGRALLIAGSLQGAALISGSFEIWFALHLFGHPVDVKSALILESMTQAVRHLAFVVPGGLGVQEAGLVIFGNALGISSELALAVSFAKRLREVLCGLPALISWQWLEGRRLQSAIRGAS